LERILQRDSEAAVPATAARAGAHSGKDN
jgi:hypothetical protein